MKLRTALEFADGSTQSTASPPAGINVLFDGQGLSLISGTKVIVPVPFNCTITGVTLFADQIGNAVVDIWCDLIANGALTNADSIVASAKPILTSAISYIDTTLTGWSKSLTTSQVLWFYLESVATITQLSVSLRVTR